MTCAVIVLNAGSSSIKFALYDSRSLAVMMRGRIDDIGDTARLEIKRDFKGRMADCGPVPQQAGHGRLVSWLLQVIRERFSDIDIIAAGHRVVHGGPVFDGPVKITPQVLARLEGFTAMAPNHQPHNLRAIEAVARTWPDIAQIACFDTAFHRTQPRLAQLFGLPRRLSDEGIIRYGFHGISYQYIASVLPQIAPDIASGRVIIAHLGNGASMCALHHGRSIATTMGFTALDGLMMGRRCGSLDPGVILYLIEQKKMTAASVNHMLRKQSGLLGVSAINNDMRDLIGDGSKEAIEAIDLFCYRAARHAGSLMVALGGLDAIVFTAGIGFNSALVREKICNHLHFTGIRLDERENRRGAMQISLDGSTPKVLVIATNEELMIARSVVSMCA